MNNNEKKALLKELEKAIYSGAQSVTYSTGGKNRSITYRSLEQMYKVKAQLEADLGLRKPGRLRNVPYFDSGL